MERDFSRYIVFKRSDVDHALSTGFITSGEVGLLASVKDRIAEARAGQGKPAIGFAVVESDWPMYGAVWDAIADWAEGAPWSHDAEYQRALGHLIQELLGDALPKDRANIKMGNIYPLLVDKINNPQCVTEKAEHNRQRALDRVRRIIDIPLGALADMNDYDFIRELTRVVDEARDQREKIAPQSVSRGDRHNSLGRRLCSMLSTPSSQLFGLTEEEIKTRLRHLLLREPKEERVFSNDPQVNTQTMLEMRSRELNSQEQQLVTNLRQFDKDKEQARKEIAALSLSTIPPDGYEPLASMFREALFRASKGKGAERHANNKPFTEQPILAYSREYQSPVGLLFQIRKKLAEYDRLTGTARQKELMDVLVYTAALAIFDQEVHGYPLSTSLNKDIPLGTLK